MRVFFLRLLLIFSLLGLPLQAADDASEMIDKHLDALIKKNKIAASPLCEDAVFIRRLYLTLTGRLPSRDELHQFLVNGSVHKRAELIDAVLASEAYVDYQVLKWGDLLRIKSEFPSNIWPNGVQAYNRWLREQIRANEPYNKMVYRLLTGTGSNFRAPAVNFYRAFQRREPDIFAENIALLFLGLRETPSCFLPFFTQVRYKKSREWKEEILYVDLDLVPKKSSVSMMDGVKIELSPKRDLRRDFATWLCLNSNQAFARCMVNRVWFWMMGRGLVNPVDDMKASNTPSHPALLAALAEEFMNDGYDIQALMRAILNTKAFSRSSLSQEKNLDKAAQLFAYYPTTRLTAEQIVDAIGDITGEFDIYLSKVPEPYSYFPHDIRAVQMGDGSVSSPQLELFGRPSRDVSLESDRNNSISTKQVLYLLNSAGLINKIRESERLGAMIAQAKDNRELMHCIYQEMLSRNPSAGEEEKLFSLLPKEKKEFANRLIWGLFNSTGFLYKH